MCGARVVTGRGQEVADPPPVVRWWRHGEGFKVFGRSRRRATTHATECVRSLVATYQHQHGLPAGFWFDPYVIGFMGFMIAFHASFTSGEKLSEDDKGHVLHDVFSALSNMEGKALVDEYKRLAFAAPKDEAFEMGADHAAAIAFTSLGKTSPETREYYNRACEIAEAMGEQKTPSTLMAIMFHNLFDRTVQERFHTD